MHVRGFVLEGLISRYEPRMKLKGDWRSPMHNVIIRFPVPGSVLSGSAKPRMSSKSISFKFPDDGTDAEFRVAVKLTFDAAAEHWIQVQLACP